jgi:tetratricopeptide (TPR) repeat protein
MLTTALSILAVSVVVALAGGLVRAREVVSDRVRLRTQAARTLTLLRELDDHVGTGDIRDRLGTTLLEQAELLAGDDEASRSMLVEAIIQAGTLARERGRPDEARLLRDRAVAEAESLASTGPQSFEARRLLSHALIVQGDLDKESGDVETATLRYERSLAIEESLLAERPADRRQLLGTGWGYERCAVLDARRADGAVLAIARLNRAEELTSRLLAIDRSDAEARWLSLMIRRHRIDLLEMRGATEEAAELRAATVAEIRALATEAVGSRRFTTALAHWLASEALRHASAGRRAEALATAAEAVEVIGRAELGDGGSIDSDAVRLWVEAVATHVGLTGQTSAEDAAPTADALARLRELEDTDPRARAFLRAFEEALAELVRPRSEGHGDDRTPSPPEVGGGASGASRNGRGATGGPPG